MAITLEEALALPQAKYQTVAESGIDINHVVNADMNSVVYTNPSSLLPIPHTDGFSTCMCIMIENMNNGTMVLGHLVNHRPQALEQLIKSMRRSPRDKLQVHMVGGMFDDVANPALNPGLEREWREEMQQLIDILNAQKNVELVTFDVGFKPHPTSVAFYKDSQNNTRLVRGSVDVASIAEMENLTRAQVHRHLRDFYPVEEFSPPKGFEPTAEIPFAVAWDGRTPDNQDWEKNPKAEQAAMRAQKPRKPGR